MKEQFNEQTRLELMKIAANLTVAHAKSHHTEDKIKTVFEHYCFYLFENFAEFGKVNEIPKQQDTE